MTAFVTNYELLLQLLTNTCCIYITFWSRQSDQRWAQNPKAIFRHDLRRRYVELGPDFLQNFPVTHAQHSKIFSTQMRSQQNTDIPGGLRWGVVQQTEAGHLLSPKALLISLSASSTHPLTRGGIVQRISCCVLTSGSSGLSVDFIRGSQPQKVCRRFGISYSLSLTRLCSHIKLFWTKCGNPRSSSQLIRELPGLRLTDITSL